MRWTAYHLMRMVNGLFVCPIKATGKKQSGNEASQFFHLALLVRLAGVTTNASVDRSQYPAPRWRWLGLACKTTFPVHCLYLACTLPVPCLCASVNHLASCHAVRATGCLFGKFVQLSSRSDCLY